MSAEAIGGKQHEKIEYRSIGLSEGFGSFHISQETLGLMGTLIGRSKEARKVNSIFGEGVNPLMRKIREGMELLGLPSDVLINHGHKRGVDGVALARTVRVVWLGFTDSAQYNVPRTRDRLRTEKIADFWRHRWLLNRLEKPGILEEVTKHTTVYPIKHGAQVDFTPKNNNRRCRGTANPEDDEGRSRSLVPLLRTTSELHKTSQSLSDRVDHAR